MKNRVYICNGKQSETIRHTGTNIAYPPVSKHFVSVVCQNINKGVRSLFIKTC